jgi:hypothetical protein
MRLVLVLVATVLLFPSISLAQDLGEEYIGLNTYLEVKGGQYKPTGDFIIYPPPNGFNGELTLGHRFSKYFALEVGYSYTKAEGNIVDTIYIHADYGLGVAENGFAYVKSYGNLASAKLMYPVDEGFVYIGGGYGRYLVKTRYDYDFYHGAGKVSEKFEGSDTITGYHYMLGTMLDWNEWSIGFEYKQTKLEKAKFEGELVGYDVELSTDMSARIISGFLQLRF